MRELPVKLGLFDNYQTTLAGSRTMSDTEIESFLPLKPADFHILFALLDGPRHGYRIARDIEEATYGQIRLAAGNLHRTVQKLIRMKLVKVSDEIPDDDPGDQRRRYYAITPLGRRAFLADASRMRALVEAVDAKNAAGGPEVRA